MAQYWSCYPDISSVFNNGVTLAAPMSCSTTWVLKNESDLQRLTVVGLRPDLLIIYARCCRIVALPTHNLVVSDGEQLEQCIKPTDPCTPAQTDTRKHTSPFLSAACCYGIPTIAGIRPLSLFTLSNQPRVHLCPSLPLLSTHSLSPGRVQNQFLLLSAAVLCPVSQCISVDIKATDHHLFCAVLSNRDAVEMSQLLLGKYSLSTILYCK